MFSAGSLAFAFVRPRANANSYAYIDISIIVFFYFWKLSVRIQLKSFENKAAQSFGQKLSSVQKENIFREYFKGRIIKEIQKFKLDL